MKNNSGMWIEALKQVYNAINQNKLADAFAFFDPAIVRIEPEGLATSGTYCGHAEVLKHFSQARSTWAEGSCKPEGFIVAGDKVVALLHVRVRLEGHTDWAEGRVSDVFTFRGEKAIEMRFFAETHAALVWAGVAVL